MGMTKILHTTAPLVSALLRTDIRDLDLLAIGMVNDMYAESSNDEYKDYARSLRRGISMHFIRIHVSFMMTMC